MKLVFSFILLLSSLSWGASSLVLNRSAFSFPKDVQEIKKIDHRFWGLCQSFGMDTNYCLLGENFIQGRVTQINSQSPDEGYLILTHAGKSVVDYQDVENLQWLLKKSLKI